MKKHCSAVVRIVRITLMSCLLALAFVWDVDAATKTASSPTSIAMTAPSNVGNEISINSPLNGKVVSGTVAIKVTLGRNVYWDQLLVDGVSVLSGSGNLTWDSTKVTIGQHTLMVRVFRIGGTTPIGQAWIVVQVNRLTPTPIPSPAVTPRPTVIPTPVATPAPVVTPRPTVIPTPVATPAPVVTPRPTVIPTPVATPAPVVTPRPTVIPTPVATPTANSSNVGHEITINVPANGQLVSGNNVAVNVTLGPDVYWDQLMVDGTSVSSASGNFIWDSTKIANAQHTLAVRVFQNGGTVPIGSAWVLVAVANPSSSASPRATPTAITTPAPTPAPGASPTLKASPSPSATPSPGAYYTTLGYKAALPTEASCVAAVSASPTFERVAGNTPFNIPPNGGTPVSFYSNPTPTKGDTQSVADFATVDGSFTGFTDDIIRVYACKWGIDENVVRAQGMTESDWNQGGAGDQQTSQSECVQPGFAVLWNNTIAEPDDSVVSCPNCCFQSWSLWQTKVYYEYTTWPMIMESTSFAADYRYADQRSCMNGDYSTYFASSNKLPNTYAADIAAYKAGGAPDTVLWGCIGLHFSGNWYDSAANSYITETQNHLNLQDWNTL